jgi:hypothetical protein
MRVGVTAGGSQEDSRRAAASASDFMAQTVARSGRAAQGKSVALGGALVLSVLQGYSLWAKRGRFRMQAALGVTASVLGSAV